MVNTTNLFYRVYGLWKLEDGSMVSQHNLHDCMASLQMVHLFSPCTIDAIYIYIHTWYIISSLPTSSGNRNPGSRSYSYLVLPGQALFVSTSSYTSFNQRRPYSRRLADSSFQLTHMSCDDHESCTANESQSERLSNDDQIQKHSELQWVSALKVYIWVSMHARAITMV